MKILISKLIEIYISYLIPRISYKNFYKIFTLSKYVSKLDTLLDIYESHVSNNNAVQFLQQYYMYDIKDGRTDKLLEIYNKETDQKLKAVMGVILLDHEFLALMDDPSNIIDVCNHGLEHGENHHNDLYQHILDLFSADQNNLKQLILNKNIKMTQGVVLIKLAVLEQLYRRGQLEPKEMNTIVWDIIEWGGEDPIAGLFSLFSPDYYENVVKVWRLIEKRKKVKRINYLYGLVKILAGAGEDGLIRASMEYFSYLKGVKDYDDLMDIITPE